MKLPERQFPALNVWQSFHAEPGRYTVQDPRTWDYFEDSRASNDTWVALDNNAGFQGALAGLNQVSGTYDQCLQGYGIMARDKDICDTKLV